MRLLARDDERALFLAGYDGEDILAAQLRERGLEIRRLVERMQFALVGEENVDAARRG